MSRKKDPSRSTPAWFDAWSVIPAAAVVLGGLALVWMIRVGADDSGIAECRIDASPDLLAAEPVVADADVPRSRGISYEETEDEEVLEEVVFDSVEFNDVIGVGGGAGGAWGGKYAGKGRAWVPDNEEYAAFVDSGFVLASADARSTFAIDVDTASYSNVRRFLEDGSLPPRDAVRVEELLNYFRYDDPYPTHHEPFAVNVEVASCPWQPRHRLARIGIRSMEIPAGNRQPANLVFLIDVSGSMQSADKLPLLKKGMQLLVDELSGRDRVAIVTYAGAAGLVLESTTCSVKEPIQRALENLRSGGSTAGGAGIRLAYDVAAEGYIPGGINRVILATDGDFNVGITDDDELTALIRGRAEKGVFLSVLGFGTGNLKNRRLEALADRGDGHYAYIDRLAEARKVLVEEVGATLETVAKDVKIQVEFDPGQVAAFRLVGYENRRLAHADFADDGKDAGEIGAGHGVTALYEIVPVGVGLDATGLVEDGGGAPVGDADEELMRVHLRYKNPEGEVSMLSSFGVVDDGRVCEAASDDFRFAAAVASFGMLLCDSAYAGEVSWEGVRALARGGVGVDVGGYRAGFLELVDRAAGLAAAR